MKNEIKNFPNTSVECELLHAEQLPFTSLSIERWRSVGFGSIEESIHSFIQQKNVIIWFKGRKFTPTTLGWRQFSNKNEINELKNLHCCWLYALTLEYKWPAAFFVSLIPQKPMCHLVLFYAFFNDMKKLEVIHSNRAAVLRIEGSQLGGCLWNEYMCTTAYQQSFLIVMTSNRREFTSGIHWSRFNLAHSIFLFCIRSISNF